MGKLAAVTCETAKPNKARDRLLGDGDGLFLRIRPHGTKTWVIEYEFRVRWVRCRSFAYLLIAEVIPSSIVP